MNFKGSACSKFILGGEHAVVHGAHAIAIPLLSKKLELTLKVSSAPVSLVLSGTAKSDSVAAVLSDLKKITNPELITKEHGFSATGSCSIPVGAGLGASAALCVALARAHRKWNEYSNADIRPAPFAQQFECQEVQKLAHALEARFHGNPSGIDTSVIAFEQPILFQKAEGVRFAPAAFAMPHFVLIDSGVRSSTKRMVQNARDYFSGSKGKRLVRRFDLVALDAWKALHQNDLQGLVDTMNENHFLLKEIEVTGEHCERIVEKSVQLGALSAKVTGAGSGGFVLAIIPQDPAEADTVLEKLRECFGPAAVIDAGSPEKKIDKKEKVHAHPNSL